MSRILDILEDSGNKYCLIEGGTAHDDRIRGIDAYNKPGSEQFIFLLALEASVSI